MPHVLIVAAGEFRHPVALAVLVKSGDGLFHGDSRLANVANKPWTSCMAAY